MAVVSLTVKVITPLFLGGANPREEPELRAASFRGMLRFWLRAALGGVIGDDDDALKRLRCLEASVFGDTERGSVVTVRRTNVTDFYTGCKLLLPLLPHRFSANPQRAGLTKAITSATFDLTLSLRPRADAKALEMATWSALLWLTLGGIGRRSRRGAGSLRIIRWTSAPANLLPQNLSGCLTAATTTPVDKQALADRIADLLDKARGTFTALAPTTNPRLSSGLPAFSILRPDTRVVVWTPSGNDYVSALTPLMNRLSARMATNANNFRDGFGGVQPSRRASPLLVTTHQLNGEFALVLTHLKANIRVDHQGNPIRGQPAEVTEFLGNLPSAEKVEAYPRAVQGGNTP